MNPEFSPEEINQIVRAARVWASGFTQEQLQKLVNSQHHLADSRFCEAAWGMVRLQQEKGIPCTEALDGYEQLLRDKAELETELASLREGLIAQQDANREAGEQYGQIKEAIEQAKEELQAVQAERQKEEKELVAFRKKAEKEKQDIDKELEEYWREANVTKEEIIGAGKLKGQLASRGFTIEFTLDLCQEFVGHKNAREELAKAIQEHGTLTKANAALIEQGKELQSQLDREQAKVKSLEEARRQLENILFQLQSDVAYEEELRIFYHRYHGGEGLLEYLATWDQIFFMRCNNPVYAMAGVFSRSAGNAHFWTDKLPTRCPHCGMTMLLPDEKPYQALNYWPVGDPIKLRLGE